MHVERDGNQFLIYELTDEIFKLCEDKTRMSDEQRETTKSYRSERKEHLKGGNLPKRDLSRKNLPCRQKVVLVLILLP